MRLGLTVSAVIACILLAAVVANFGCYLMCLPCDAFVAIGVAIELGLLAVAIAVLRRVVIRIFNTPKKEKETT